MMKSLNLPTLYFLFYFFEIPEIFPYKTPDLEYVNFATSCISLKKMLCQMEIRHKMQSLCHLIIVLHA
jgi:hypothetical protein